MPTAVEGDLPGDADLAVKANLPGEMDLAPVQSIVAKIEQARASKAERLGRDDLIPLLQQIQDAYGYLPVPVLKWASRRTGIPMSRMYGVSTFYAQFSLKPHGRHVVRCCRGTACHVRGGKKIIGAVQGMLGLKDGETAEDMSYTFETVACLGACALAPVMIVDSTYYGKMTPRRSEQILHGLGKETE